MHPKTHSKPVSSQIQKSSHPDSQLNSLTKNQSGQKNPPFNLSQYIIGNMATKCPDAPAFELIDLKPSKQQTSQHPNHKNPLPCNLTVKMTYAELDSAIRKIANGLIKPQTNPETGKQTNLEKGDFLLIHLPSGPTYALTFFAAIAAGLVPVPLSPQLSAREIDFFQKDTGARCMVNSPSLTQPEQSLSSIHSLTEQTILKFIDSETPLPYAATNAEDPAYLIYTSGTSSHPKGVLHAQRTILGRLPMQQGWHHIQPIDRVLHAGDFNWTYSLGVGLMDPWLMGATALIYVGPKSPEIWPQLINTHKTSIFAAVPGVYRQILKYAPDQASKMPTLKYGLSAGENLGQELHENWHKITATHLYEAMGQSEISTYVSTHPANDKTENLTTSNQGGHHKGTIQPGRNIVILPADEDETLTELERVTPLPANQTGLIAVHNTEPGLMLGYWNKPDEMKNQFRGEWFLTGDSGQIDEQQNLTHFGRTDDLMNASGYRVSPLEVETAILSHPAISEATVLEQRINPGLSIIRAFLILKSQSSTQLNANSFKPSEIIASLQQHLCSNLATYKHPKSFEIVKEYPRNKTGKILRKKLPELHPLPVKQSSK